MAKSKLKSLTFSTTLRNPERYITFLHVIHINGFNGKILDYDVLDEIVANVLKSGIYTPSNLECDLTKKSILQIRELLPEMIQKHKEAGFLKGWHSRWDTWYKPIMELGFIDYSPDNKISITQTGMAMLEDKDMEQVYFLNAMIRMKFGNPFRKATNMVSPVPLLLRVLKKLDANKLMKDEILLLLCTPDNNVDLILETIQASRKLSSNEKIDYIYQKCLEWQGSPGEKFLKESKLFKESTDDFVRKMRFIGVIDISSSGYSVTINNFQKDLIEYIDKFFEFIKFESKDDYVKYLSTVDAEFMQIISSMENIYETDEVLSHWKEEISQEEVVNVIDKIIKSKKNIKTSSQLSGSFKYSFDEIDNPILLEFFVSLYMSMHNEKWDIRPNCLFDANYIPYFHAPGGKPDIEIYDVENKKAGIVEVTLLRGRNQLTLEAVPICRHLRAFIEEKSNYDCFGIYMSPNIHSDVVDYFAFEKHRSNLDFTTIALQNISELQDISKYSQKER